MPGHSHPSIEPVDNSDGDSTAGSAADSSADSAAGSAADSAAERRKQLLTAPKADDDDAAPRIDVTEVDAHTTRIDVRDDARYRPGAGS